MAATRQKTRKDDPDGPIAGNGDGQVRMCAVTRAELAPGQLIRFVRAPDGALVPDLEHRLPGRGVWLTCAREVVEKAIKIKAFGRSLRTDVAPPPDLPDRLDAMLVKRAVDTLALANKAGLIISGFQQVDAALEKGSVKALVHGADAAADGRGKLDRKFRAISREKGLEAAIVDNLTIAQMSLAIGRPSVVHAALIPGGLAKRFLREVERVARYRSSSALSQISDPAIGPADDPASETH